MFKKNNKNTSTNTNSISGGKKVIGFFLSFLGVLFFLSIWFLLEKIFKIVTIEEVFKTTIELLKNNFSLKIWTSDFYFSIIKTIFNVFVSFTICLLFGIIIGLINKFYYFKSFLKPIKIITLIPLLFIAYFVSIWNVNFNHKIYKLNDIVFPVIVTVLVNCAFFANFFIKKNEEDFFSSIIKGVNLTFVVAVSSETILINFKKISMENFGGLITSYFNQDNAKVISLILIFCLVILIFDLIVIITKKIIDSFKK